MPEISDLNMVDAKLSRSELLSQPDHASNSRLFEDAYKSGTELIKDHSGALAVGTAVVGAGAALYFGRAKIFSALANSETNFGYKCLDTAAQLGSRSANFEMGLLHLEGSAGPFTKCTDTAISYFEKAGPRGLKHIETIDAIRSEYSTSPVALDKAIRQGLFSEAPLGSTERIQAALDAWVAGKPQAMYRPIEVTPSMKAALEAYAANRDHAFALPQEIIRIR